MNLAHKNFMESNVWDSRYDLPLLPDHNNPWIYAAYALKIIKSWGEDVDNLYLTRELIEHANEKCRVEKGLYHRWPDGFGGHTSHDELIGLCYIDAAIAKDVLNYLDFNDGVYNNLKNTVTSLIPDRYNLYRFLWLRPYIAECAKARLNILSQLKWAGFVVANALFKKAEGWDTKLMIWLMSERMENHTICKLAILFWESRMKKLGLNPHVFFEKELEKFPVYSRTVKSTF